MYYTSAVKAEGIEPMTRTPRDSLSPDAIKLIVKVLRSVVRRLDNEPHVETVLGDITIDIVGLVNACTEEVKS